MSVTFNRVGVSQLQDCRLFIFDLDGTVYQEVHHFPYYGERLAALMAPEAATAFLKDVDLILEGRHALAMGDTYDAHHRVIHKKPGTVTWSGEASSLAQSDKLIGVEDPWWVYGATARYHGLSAEQVDTAFLQTRAYMESPQFEMTPLPGLRPAIDRLRKLGRHFVLATNSPEPDSRAILEKLGLLGAFDDMVFMATKPHQTKHHFERWQQKFALPYAQMASIGDNYRNEIAPALALGMKAVYIDSYIKQPRPDVTLQVESPTDLGPLMQAVVETLE